ncbi:hypothetical protein M426DRAFT_323388 [Hypoxylon sp. CI-4A]|nr:hypothetical protein M426DRAFT_323388 [Hypoxylon sp. CI-4A]
MEQDNHTKETRKDSKGKGVTTNSSGTISSLADQDGHSSVTETNSPSTSLISRLGASASKLADNMIRRPPDATYLSDSLSPGKAGPSQQAGSGSGSASANESSTYKSGVPLAPSNGSFKSMLAQERHDSGESNFSSFLDSTNTLGKQDFADNVERYGYDPEMRQTPRDSVIMATDGMDVVGLLSSGYDEVEEASMSLQDNEEAALRHRLFEASQTLGPPTQKGQWEDALNFFPDSKSGSNGLQEYAELLGISDLEEAKKIWVDQWQRVLSSYTDEVWGDLSPLVHQAQEELQDLSNPHEGDPSSKPKALRRLQQILSHLGGI